jgi:hypothetical protein
MDTEIVVTRYNEKLEWLNTQPFSKYRATIYNKGTNLNINYSNNIKKIINLPNIGLDVHSFIYHIINNYDNLSNITVFFQGSINKRRDKYIKCLHVIDKIEKTNTSIIACTKENNFLQKNSGFVLNNYPFSSEENRSHNSDVTFPCKIRPFGPWFYDIFNKWHATPDNNDPLTLRSFDNICYCHILSLKKEDILKKPKEYYIYLLTFLEEGLQPEAVHYFERAWALIFYPLSQENLLYF